MGQLMTALETGQEPAIGGRDNLHTMALIEAAYRAAERRCAVEIAEVLAEAGIA